MPKDRCTETTCEVLEGLSIEKILNDLSNDGIDGLFVVGYVIIETVLDVVGDAFIVIVLGVYIETT